MLPHELVATISPQIAREPTVACASGNTKETNTVNTSPSIGRRSAFGVWLWVCGLLLALACSAPAPSQGKKPDLYDLDANLVLLSPKVKPIYLKALGPLAHEQWLARLDGPAPQNKRVTIAGSDFVHMSSCKTHNCADNNAVFLYSPEQGPVRDGLSEGQDHLDRCAAARSGF